MEDPESGRSTPVHTDPWVMAHTPKEDATANLERKKRRSWFTGGSPVKAVVPNVKGRSPLREKEDIPTLQLTHFTKKVMLSFDDVRLGSTKVLHLRLENPHDYPQELAIEKFPFSKGFTVPDTVWEVMGKETLDVPISWTPEDEKNVRELVTFKCEGAFRLQLIVLGTVKVPKKKKNINRRSTFTARKGQAVQSSRNVAPVNPRRETFIKRSPRSRPYPITGKENKSPLAGEKSVASVGKPSPLQETFTKQSPRSQQPEQLRPAVGKPSPLQETPIRQSPRSQPQQHLTVLKENKPPATETKSTTPREKTAPLPAPFFLKSPTSEVQQHSIVLKERNSPAAVTKTRTSRDGGSPILASVAEPSNVLKESNSPDVAVMTSSTPMDRGSPLPAVFALASPELLAQAALDENSPVAVKIATPRRETFFKLTPSVDPNKVPDAGMKSAAAERKARARSVGTVLERILTPKGKVERVMVGETVCTFSPQLTAKALVEITGDSPLTSRPSAKVAKPAPATVRTVSAAPKRPAPTTPKGPARPKKQRPSPPEAKDEAPSKSGLKPALSSSKGAPALPTSRNVNRTVALRKAAALGKPAATARAPVVKKPRSKVKVPKVVKGVPMAKLQLIKPSSSALPRHPLPFAAKNIFYDERWIEKQERAFTCWLNYILTPDIDTPKDPNKSVKIDAHLLCLEGAAKVVGPAPSREALSMRAYTAQRRLNRLRRGACLVFQSEPVMRVLQRVEAEVEKGLISVRNDRMIHADLGIKQEVLNLILSYNPLWLRIGLETTYGELLPIQDNGDIYGMSRFIVTRLLGNPDIAAAYAHPTVPNLFGPGYQESLAQFTLKKFLMLVFFLDRAKLTRLIDHDPCLFSKEAPVKSSRDLLLEFSRRYLKGEGDLTRHLSFLGYSVTHVQRPLDEFDFAINKLAVDLRCGVRLSRVVELLTKNWTLSCDLRVPAISRLQKIHNVELAFKMLKDRGIDVAGGGLNERAIVDGHREKTLELLWRIIFHYQVGVMLNEEQLREEIAYLTKHRRLQREMSALRTGEQRPSGGSGDGGPHLYFKSPQLMLLMDWCKAVCSSYDMQIENFTVSFCDGRALCLLVHHYHPSLLPLETINQETTLQQFQQAELRDLNQSDSSFDGTWSHTFSPSTGKETDHDRLLANERQNFKVLYAAVNELGGVPLMVKSADMSNTIPDEKVVITYVAYLCARLLDLRWETRAARRIQLAWRAYRVRAERKMRGVKEAAAIKLQSAARAFLHRRRLRRTAGAVLMIQTAARGFMARRRVQRLRMEREAEKQNKAAAQIQALVRGFLTRRAVLHQHRAATHLQACVRGFLTSQRLAKRHRAAALIQDWYLSQREMKISRERFMHLKQAAVQMQAVWRGILVQRRVKQILAARTLQAAWRGLQGRRAYLKQRRAAVLIQSVYRGHRASTSYRSLRGAVIKMQAIRRAGVKGQTQRREYVSLQAAAVTLQKMYRGKLDRRLVLRIRSAVKIQAIFRGCQQRTRYQKMRQSAVIIQAAWRGQQATRSYAKMRGAALVLQSRFRAVRLGRRVCREYHIARGAAITIQAAVRCHQTRKQFLKMRRDITIVQALVRRQQAQKMYRRQRASAVIIQRRYRALLMGRQCYKRYNVMRGAAITIQALVRCHQVRQGYIQARGSIVKAQSVVKGHLARKRYRQQRAAAMILQARYRAVLLGRNTRNQLQTMKAAATSIQAAWKGYVVCKEYRCKRSAAIKMQSIVRCLIAKQRYREVQVATKVLQTRYRALVMGRQLEREYYIIRGAIITLQAATRGFLQRREYLQMRAAAIALQASIRCFLAQRDYARVRSATVVLQRQYRALVAGRETRSDFQASRSAAITLQAAFRGHVQRLAFLKQRSAVVTLQSAFRRSVARRDFLELRRATIVLQTRYRAHHLAKMLSQDFEQKRCSAITLQSAYRGFAQRKRFLQQKQAAIIIQALVRGSLQQRKFTRIQRAVAVLQTRFRAWKMGRTCIEEFYLARGKIITIQALYRGYAARKVLNTQRTAATLIQANFRRFVARKKYLRTLQSVIILQTRLRATLEARQLAKAYQQKRAAAITLQAIYRGRAQRKVIARQHQAATLLQATFRRFVLRKRYVTLRKATCVIQQWFRNLQLSRAACEEYNIKRGAIITIQAAYRGHMQRQIMRKQKQAATSIQAAVRAHQAQRKFAVLRKAAVVLQTRFRAHLLRERLSLEYNLMRGAAITMQAVYRGHMQRQILKRQTQAATSIQAAVRAHQAQKRYTSMRKAAIIIQTRFRAHLLRECLAFEYNLMRGAAIIIQAVYRGHIQRKALSHQHLAATKIQSAFRGFATQRRYQRICRAALVLQTWFRACKLCLSVQEEYKSMKQAAIVLQAAYRGHHQRLVLAQQHSAATRIQTMVRSYVARKRYLALYSATRVIQQRFRAHHLRCRVQREYHITVGAIITLQAAFRGLAVRRDLRKQHQSATRIQAHFRGFTQRRKYQDIVKAVNVLQERVRAYQLGRSVREEYRLKVASAVKIQALYRCHRNRKAFSTSKQAAIRIQAAVRAHLAVVYAKNFREERTGAAVVFQRHWRANVLRDQQVRCYNIQRGAAITLQAAVRTYLVQRSIRRQHKAATYIQAAYRCHRAVQSYKRVLSAVGIIQDCLRAHLLARQVQEEFAALKSAALTVQSTFRGCQVRRRIAAEHAAAARIQAKVRQFLGRRRYQELRKAAIVLQTRFRARVSCQEEMVRYHMTRGACITIQATVRGFLVRCSVRKMNKAATSIQSAFRGMVQQREYLRTRALVVLLQRKVRAVLERRKVQDAYLAMKSAAVVLQSSYRGLMARRLAKQHRAARLVQSTYRMHVTRQRYLKQQRSAVQIQAAFRMQSARRSYQRVQQAVRTLQVHTRGYLAMKKARHDYLQTLKAVVVMQSQIRCHLAVQQFQKLRRATVTVQSHYRRLVLQRRFNSIKDATLVLQRRYRGKALMEKTMLEYHVARGAVITLQSVFRGYLQCCRYRQLRYHAVRMQARVRGGAARRRCALMVRERKAAVCIQRHVRGFNTRKALETQRQARLVELRVFSDRARAHLSVIRLQRAFRNYQLRRIFKERMDAIHTIQTWMKARLQRLRFLKLRDAALVLQRAARRYLERKNQAATRLQSVARVWLAKQHVSKMQSAALKMQALWRGHKVRCSIKSKKVSQARARCRRANANVTEEKRLCNRAASALDYLLHYKSMARILETLINLEVVSRLSPICCQRMVEGGAVPVLYALVRSCNRSIPCMEIIQYITSILLNLTKNESSQHAVLDGEEPVATLLDLLQIYREKSKTIFCKTCVILGKLLQDHTQAQVVLSYPNALEKIASLHKLTSRKHALDERRTKNKSLNASSLNTSSFLHKSSNVSASFVAGTPRKRRHILSRVGAEWNIEDPMRAVDFLKIMAERA